MFEEGLLETDGPVLDHLGELGHTAVQKFLVIYLRILDNLPKVHANLVAKVCKLATAT